MFFSKKKNVKYHFWKKKNEERLFIRIEWKYIFSTKFYNLLPRVIDDNPSTLGMFHKSFQITEWRKRWEFIRMFILYKYKTLLPGCIRYWTFLSVRLSLIIHHYWDYKLLVNNDNNFQIIVLGIYKKAMSERCHTCSPDKTDFGSDVVPKNHTNFRLIRLNSYIVLRFAQSKLALEWF